jgi:hypothetical protein
MTEDRETVDYVAITRLQAAYADAVNTRSWTRLASLFAPGAQVSVNTMTRPVIELEGGDAMATFIAGAIERFEFFEFVTLNTVVDLDVDDDPDHARARLFMCELRQERGTKEFSRAFGVYQDDYRRTAGGWRFAARRYQSLARTGGEVFPVPD